MAFFELSERILKLKGKLTYIVPNTWLLNLKTPNIRKLIYTKFNLIKIKVFENPVFEEAIVDTLILIGSKDKFDSYDVVVEIQKRNMSLVYNRFNKALLAQTYNSALNIYLSEIAKIVLEKTKNCERLENVAKITQGTKPFQMGKGIPKQTIDILNNKPYVQEYKKDETFRPLLRGSLINRYRILWDNNYYISFGDWLAEPRYSANYDCEKKIVIRQTGSGLIATLDRNKFIVRDNLYTIVSTNIIYSEEYILGLLNSKFLNWYYQNIINNEVGEALAQVKRGHLCQLPIALPNPQSELLIIEKVIQLLSSNSMELFSVLETEIDQLVYQLYGLSEEEIQIVEGR